MSLGWKVSAHTTGEDSWSIEFSGTAETVLDFLYDTNLPMRLQEIDGQASVALQEQMSSFSLSKGKTFIEYESKYLSIKKFHL